jgi:hypothetical protein
MLARAKARALRVPMTGGASISSGIAMLPRMKEFRSWRSRRGRRRRRTQQEKTRIAPTATSAPTTIAMMPPVDIDLVETFPLVLLLPLYVWVGDDAGSVSEPLEVVPARRGLPAVAVDATDMVVGTLFVEVVLVDKADEVEVVLTVDEVDEMVLEVDAEELEVVVAGEEVFEVVVGAAEVVDLVVGAAEEVVEVCWDVVSALVVVSAVELETPPPVETVESPPGAGATRLCIRRRCSCC